MKFVHPDPSDEQHRNIVKHLREQHLSGVDIDDENDISLEIEMSRVILLAAGGSIVLSATKVFDSTKPIYWPLFLVAELCLIASALLAWISLYLATIVRRRRVSRKFKIYFAELDERLQAINENRAVNYPKYLNMRHEAFETENRLSRLNDKLRLISAALVGLGIISLLFAMMMSVHRVALG